MHFFLFPGLSITFSVLPRVKAFIPTFNFNSQLRNLAFQCQVAMPSKYQQYFFDISWYINKKEVSYKPKIPYSKLDTDGVLHRKDWDKHSNGPKVLGFWVSCLFLRLIRIHFDHVNKPWQNFYCAIDMNPKVLQILCYY